MIDASGAMIMRPPSLLDRGFNILDQWAHAIGTSVFQSKREGNDDESENINEKFEEAQKKVSKSFEDVKNKL